MHYNDTRIYRKTILSRGEHTMPESRKRKKKNQETPDPVYTNPLKKTWGKVVVVILVVGFVLGLAATTIFVMWSVMFG